MVEKVIYNELPATSRHLRLWEMTDAQQALTGLAATLRTYGVHVRFERDELDRYGLRFVERLNAFTALMDEHTIHTIGHGLELIGPFSCTDRGDSRRL